MKHSSLILLLLLFCSDIQGQDTNYYKGQSEWNTLRKNRIINDKLNDSILLYLKQSQDQAYLHADSAGHWLSQNTSIKDLAFRYVSFACDTNLIVSNNIKGKLFLSAAHLFDSIHNDYASMQCYTHLLVSCFLQGDNYKALDYSRKAMDIAISNGFSKNTAIISSNIALIYIKLGDYEKANEANFQAIQIFKSLKDTLQIARCKLSIGSVFLELKDFNKALEYITDANTIFYSINELTGYSITLTNIGLIYIKMKEYRKALRYFFQAVEIDEGNNDDAGRSSNYSSIGLVYFHIGNYTRAMDYFKQAKGLFEKLGDKSGLAGVFLNISRIYTKQNHFQKALTYSKKSLSLNELTGESSQRSDILEHMAAIYQKMGDYQNAFQKYRMAKELKDSLFTIERAAKIAMLEEKYLREKLEKKNLALTYTNSAQKSKIKNQKKLLGIYLMTISISLISICIIILQYRKRNTAYKYIVSKNLDLIQTEQEYKKLKQQIESQTFKEKTTLSISEEEKERVINRLEKLMETEKIYTRPDLTIDKLARRINTNRTYLSQIINEKHHKNYSNFINDFRIKEAMRLLSDPEKKEKYSIDAIASEAGFHTISNFNSVFKKQTGITPSIFRKIS